MDVIDGGAAEQLTVTSLEDLQSYARGAVVKLADFADGQPFVARVRRPSMLALAKLGKIPNELLDAACDLFTKGVASSPKSSGGKMLTDLYDVCHVICEAALIEPTLKQIEDAGLELSDDQVIDLFNYTQNGVRALKSFRQQ